MILLGHSFGAREAIRIAGNLAGASAQEGKPLRTHLLVTVDAVERRGRGFLSWVLGAIEKLGRTLVGVDWAYRGGVPNGVSRALNYYQTKTPFDHGGPISGAKNTEISGVRHNDMDELLKTTVARDIKTGLARCLSRPGGN